MSAVPLQPDLFDRPILPGLPDGFVYRPEFVTLGEEAALLAAIAQLPYRPGEKQRREDAIAITLEARSVYSITRTARWGWQHSIPPTRELRYSITFRTARGHGPRAASV
jgi:hypothetical protein